MSERSPEFRRLSDDSARRRTGKGWEEWMSVLDAWGAPERGRTESARYLRDTHGVSPWWAQALTVRYEYERGLREPR